MERPAPPVNPVRRRNSSGIPAIDIALDGGQDWGQGQFDEMVAGGGIEPPTQGFSVLCSTN